MSPGCQLCLWPVGSQWGRAKYLLLFCTQHQAASTAGSRLLFGLQLRPDKILPWQIGSCGRFRGLQRTTGQHWDTSSSPLIPYIKLGGGHRGSVAGSAQRQHLLYVQSVVIFQAVAVQIQGRSSGGGRSGCAPLNPHNRTAAVCGTSHSAVDAVRARHKMDSLSGSSAVSGCKGDRGNAAVQSKCHG